MASTTLAACGTTLAAVLGVPKSVAFYSEEWTSEELGTQLATLPSAQASELHLEGDSQLTLLDYGFAQVRCADAVSSFEW
jgi:hypothetical protein